VGLLNYIYYGINLIDGAVKLFTRDVCDLTPCLVVGSHSMTASRRDLFSDCGILKIRCPISGIILKLLPRQNKAVIDT
jgi:hypothetical protein